jgi:hypothetical protein
MFSMPFSNCNSDVRRGSGKCHIEQAKEKQAMADIFEHV